MDNIFVTAARQPVARWKQAFPDALVVSRVEDIHKELTVSKAVIWIDISTLPHEKKIQEIGSAVEFEWPVVVMTTTPVEAEAFRVLNAGASGYCHIQAAPDQLRKISTVVEHNGTWMPTELMQRLLKLSLRVAPTGSAAGSALDKLTTRELAVAQQVAVGATNREISDRLEITERTVKAHLSAIFEKLGVRDRVQLALCMNNIETSTIVN